MFASARHHAGTVTAGAIAAALAFAMAACGDSKPAYCSDRSDLQSSVQDLSSVNLRNGLSDLEAQLKQVAVALDVKTVASSFKSFSDATQSQCS